LLGKNDSLFEKLLFFIYSCLTLYIFVTYILSILNMKIIIAGAGDVGFHLAKLLSYESQDT
jgi:hypothetical protein